MLKKKAQNFTSLAYNPQLQGKTLADLYLAIRADAGLPASQKAQLVNQVKGMTGFSGDSTPLSALTMKGLGGVVGWMISKYFGAGPVGQMFLGLTGYGMGSLIHSQLNKPKDPHPGWRMM